VSDGELRRRAAELGVSVNYWDWQGREITVPDETLRAIVTALESVPSEFGLPLGEPVEVALDAVAPVPP
jgi:hypothetical protein